MSDLKMIDEIFSGIKRFDDALQKVHKANELRSNINALNPSCGNCQYWMTKKCPREINLNGRSRGPSMSGIACSIFIEKEDVTQRRQELQQKLDDLESEMKSNAS